MYRDTEFSYRDFKCDCYQAFGGLWCVDFYLPTSTAPMQTIQATRKADAMREAKEKMDRWLMTDLERAMEALRAFADARTDLLDGCEWNFGQLEAAYKLAVIVFQLVRTHATPAPPPTTPAATPSPTT